MGQRPGIVAHRGGAKLWPENTMEAFEGALALGVDGIEIDVHLGADGEVWVHHDPTLGRTTTGTGELRARRTGSVRRLRVRGRDARIPTLREFLDLVAPTDTLISIEFKVDARRRPYQGLERAVIDRLREFHRLDHVLLHSFDRVVARRLRRLAPFVDVAANLHAHHVRTGQLSAAIERVARGNLHHINVDHRSLDAHALSLARYRGLAVTVWTVDRDEDLAHWLQAGVDWIATDRPDRALDLRAALPLDEGPYLAHRAA